MYCSKPSRILKDRSQLGPAAEAAKAWLGFTMSLVRANLVTNEKAEAPRAFLWVLRSLLPVCMACQAHRV